MQGAGNTDSGATEKAAPNEVRFDSLKQTYLSVSISQVGIGPGGFCGISGKYCCEMPLWCNCLDLLLPLPSVLLTLRLKSLVRRRQPEKDHEARSVNMSHAPRNVGGTHLLMGK